MPTMALHASYFVLPDVKPVDASISGLSSITVPRSFRQLSAGSAESEDLPQGFFYTPTLPSSADSACSDKSRTMLPKNVIRIDDFSDDAVKQGGLIALAPGINADCARAYVNAAAADSNAAANSGTGNVSAIILYNNPMRSNSPGDSNWNLGDPAFPIFLMTGTSGVQLAHLAAQYSGNLSGVKQKQQILNQYPDATAIRLHASFTMSDSNATVLPSLWVFLLIVLGILLLIIGTTSTSMHIVQRRRRRDLRRRIQAGEVDLSLIGLKHVTVPQDAIDKFPIETYNPENDSDEDRASLPAPPDTIHEAGTPADDVGIVPAAANTPLPMSPAKPSAGPVHSATHSTCAICIDDFEPQKTRIRVLPCKHAFHPDCIDPFLLSSSSLCPLCKQSVLPADYCPPVTNAMVRRERMMLRAHEQRTELQTYMMNRTAAATNASGRAGGVTRDQVTDSADAEHVRALRRLSLLNPTRAARRRNRDSVVASNTEEPPAEQSSAERQEWTRRRAEALAGINTNDDVAEDAAQPVARWRRVVGRVFPVFL